MPAQEHTHRFRIKVDGNPLADVVDQSLVAAFVDDSVHLPDLFQLRFRDPSRTVIEEGGFKIGSSVDISMSSESVPGGEKLVTGEVTALEAEIDSGGTMTVVRGLDHSHRLCRGRVTQTYTDVTYSDVATAVARRSGLEVGRVDPSSVVHAHVSQGNMTDWQFVKGLAAEIGYETGCIDGKFQFRAPAESSGGPSEGTLASDDPLQLTLGTTLLRLRATVSSAEQVKEVRVRGWDMRQKKELVGSAPARTRSATLDVEPAELAAEFGNPDYVGVDTPYATQAEVDAAARALAEKLAGAFAELEGVARGNPRLRAGKAVSLGLMNKPFDGRYTLTTTRHVYDPKDGYTVWFTVSGQQERSLLGLATGAVEGSASRAAVQGVVPALVTDVNDPDDLARVKVKFPWLSDSYDSDWARTVQPGAGSRRGAVVLPEVNDEVLIAFEQGDIRRPYVLGGLHNGVDTPELGRDLVDAAGGVRRRGFISKKGHKLVFLDDDPKSGVLLATADDGLRLALKDTGTTIRITSRGQVEIEGQTDVTVKAQGRMRLEAGAGLTIDGGPMVEVKGSVIKLN